MPMPCWLKHLCSIRALVPMSIFLSLSLSLLYFWLIPWSAEARWGHFIARASKTLWRRRTAPSPTWEGAWCPRAAARALRTGLYWLSRKPGDSSLSLTLGTTRFQSIKGPTKNILSPLWHFHWSLISFLNFHSIHVIPLLLWWSDLGLQVSRLYLCYLLASKCIECMTEEQNPLGFSSST